MEVLASCKNRLQDKTEFGMYNPQNVEESVFSVSLSFSDVQIYFGTGGQLFTNPCSANEYVKLNNLDFTSKPGWQNTLLTSSNSFQILRR